MRTFSTAHHRLGRARATALGAQDGFLLVEVLVSALIVAGIVVAMFTGFDVVNRATADERHHDQAILLATQSQEQLRSDPASTLNALIGTPHTFTRTLSGTVFTIEQSAKSVGSSGLTTGCSAVEAKAQTTANIKISSTVTWPQLASTKRPKVEESSIITPPTGSGLEVDVLNGSEPPAAVSGISVVAKYTPSEGSGVVSLEGTTGEGGCVDFAGIPAENATVEIVPKVGYVTPSGAWQIAAKEVSIAPNITTHYTVTLDEGGAIKGEFTYNKLKTYEHENNAKTKSTETVTGDTFLAANAKMNLAPNFEVGSTAGKFTAESAFEVTRSTYATSATTPIEATHYPNGNLFPFASEKWKAYAGDCKENNPETFSGGTVKPPETLVSRKTTTAVAVPTSYVKLNLYKGENEGSAFEEAAAWPVTVTNTECKSITPDNGVLFSEPKHVQKTTTSASFPSYGGHLASPFQPFGKATLCLAYNSGGIFPLGTHETFTATYTLAKEGGATINFYLGTLLGKLTELVTKQKLKNVGGETVEVVVTILKNLGEAKCP